MYECVLVIAVTVFGVLSRCTHLFCKTSHNCAGAIFTQTCACGNRTLRPLSRIGSPPP